MSSNKNLFYNLYSTTNNIANSGYICSSAIDERGTSFDITASATGGSNGVITDSNGHTLNNIDMSKIHASQLTQYNTETRVLQPHSGCVLQGQEFGLACATYYYVIPKHVKETDRYEYYIDCDFDIIYNNFAPKKYHVGVKANSTTSIVSLINKSLAKHNIEIAVSIQSLRDEIDGNTYEYFVFQSQKEAYFYYINNIKITLNFQSEDYPDSPFTKSIDNLKPYMYDLIVNHHPIRQIQQINETTGEVEWITPVYDKDSYKVDCDLFSWLLLNYLDAVKDMDSFAKMIEYLRNAMNAETDEETIEWIEKANIVIRLTAYDVDLFNHYDIDNIEIIYNIINEIKLKVDDLDDYYKKFYWLKEDSHKRVPLMKYPNGAYRGIVLIPDWPEKTDDYEHASLWVNHIKSEVKLYIPVKHHKFIQKTFGVLANATLVKEESNFRACFPDFGNIQLNNSQHTLPDGWDDLNLDIPEGKRRPHPLADNDIDTNYLDPYRPDKDIDDDLAYMGQNYYDKKKNIIGLFRYMQYVHENNLWNKVGKSYMIIGNDDNPQSLDLNLPTSLIIYNPNPEPIRIKYMIFS